MYYFKSNNSQNTSKRFTPLKQGNIGHIWWSLSTEQKRSSDYVLHSSKGRAFAAGLRDGRCAARNTAVRGKGGAPECREPTVAGECTVRRGPAAIRANSRGYAAGGHRGLRVRRGTLAWSAGEGAPACGAPSVAGVRRSLRGRRAARRRPTPSVTGHRRVELPHALGLSSPAARRVSQPRLPGVDGADREDAVTAIAGVLRSPPSRALSDHR